MDKAFFLDRDGTLNVDYNYVHKPEQWTWCDGAIDALEWIYNHNFKIIVVTNQSGISRGRYSEAEVDHLHQWVDKELEQRNISIDGWYYAPHHPDHDSNREYDPQDRKPGTGMFKKAAKKFNIDFNQSYMAGDKITDLQPAISLGIKPLFIHSGGLPKQDRSWLESHGIQIYKTLWRAIQDLQIKDVSIS